MPRIFLAAIYLHYNNVPLLVLQSRMGLDEHTSLTAIYFTFYFFKLFTTELFGSIHTGLKWGVLKVLTPVKCLKAESGKGLCSDALFFMLQ